MGTQKALLVAGVIGVAALVICAAMITPNLLERRGPSGESTAVRVLQDIWKAEVQFQGGAYVDQDGDRLGEFGLLGELAGGPVVGQSADLAIRLLPDSFREPGFVHGGYRFLVYLPDGKGGALTPTIGARAPHSLAAPEQSRHFVAYAWPSTAESAQPIYAIVMSGSVYRSKPMPPAADPPVWNALWNGNGWKDPPAWELYKKR